MANISSRKARPCELAFQRQRLKNRVYAVLAKFFAEEAKAGRTTKKDIADFLGRDPAQITRWLNAPSNMTLETISDLLLAMDAEPGGMTIERFADKPKPNYAHPLVAGLLEMSTGAKQPNPATSSVSRFEVSRTATMRLSASDSMAWEMGAN